MNRMKQTSDRTIILSYIDVGMCQGLNDGAVISHRAHRSEVLWEMPHYVITLPWEQKLFNYIYKLIINNLIIS